MFFQQIMREKINTHSVPLPKPSLTFRYLRLLLRLESWLEFAPPQLYIGRSHVIYEPDELSVSHRPHTRSGKTKLEGVQDIMQDLSFPPPTTIATMNAIWAA